MESLTYALLNVSQFTRGFIKREPQFTSHRFLHVYHAATTCSTVLMHACIYLFMYVYAWCCLLHHVPYTCAEVLNQPSLSFSLSATI